MYLKRLEILGFKSFADKIKLEFKPGITAVVGPNGSGKSNISDALRWVLGEQSIKNLRGTKMDDVIFAGTQIRKPLGLAEVTIVLDNSDNSIPIDFNEVSITRKLFRSGESEYLINKSAVRLRDIHELFYDTGIGKEAYSVIGQGKIDSILSAKAEDRRLIFEEAAGIIKYKTRKQVAQRKLDETDRNLLRLKDILLELDSQLAPLQTQSALAEQYLAIKQDLTKLEINHSGVILKELQLKLDELNLSQTQLAEKYQDFEGQENIIESATEELRLELLGRDETISKLHEDFYRVKNQIDKFLEQLNFTKAKLQDLDQQEVECQQTGQVNLEQQTSLQEQAAILETAVVAIRAKYTVDQAKLEAQQETLATQNEVIVIREASEQELKDEVIEGLKEIAILKNKLNSTDMQKGFLAKQAAECQKKQALLEQQITKHQTELQKLQESLALTGQELSASHQLELELAKRLIELEAEQTSVQAKNLDWKELIRGLESQIKLLEEMERGYQGYFQGVKAILADAANAPFAKGIKGIVADLIKVQPGMELAIETALGSAVQHIIIDHESHAEEAIAYLKSNSKGRATFLPLNSVKAQDSRLQSQQDLLQQMSCQAASAILQFDPVYRQVINYLLGQTVVAPDLKTAIKIAAKLEKGFRVVTPDGDLVNPGGSITGGSIDKRRLGLLSRRREIEDLKKERQDALAFLEKGLHSAQELKTNLSQISAKLEEAKQHSQQTKLNQLTLERETQSIQQQLEQLRQEVGIYNEQLVELNAEDQDCEAGKVELAQLITVKEESLQATQTQLTELTAEMRLLQVEKEANLQVISELKSILSAALQEEQGKLELKAELARQAVSSERSITDSRHKLGQLQTERLRNQDLIRQVEAELALEEGRLQEQEALIAVGKQEKEATQLKIKELELKQRSFRRKHNDLQNQLHRSDLLVTQTSLQIENLQEHLTENYGSEWSEQLQPLWEEPSDAAMRIELLKNQLRDLGPVNLAAIEDCQQVHQRFHFLTSQADDLNKARETLEKVISEIERTIIKRFTDALEIVRVKFKKIFAELFEGGTADLYLFDNEKPLDTGIEIIAQPPGKKLQSLSLLSGGERAMTAIALLFAILDYKPSPFCVLDEIDATLDEVNVHRFSLLLDLFSKQLQFIVVTHRRGTMEVANTVYGVTMEELGVSKLISLDLKSKAG